MSLGRLPLAVLEAARSFVNTIREKRYYETDVLRIPVQVDRQGWFGGRIEASNVSHGYHGILKLWWDRLGLGESVLLVGEEGAGGASVKRYFSASYPRVRAQTVGLRNADVCWDITTAPKFQEKYGAVICQATLEHVLDPVAAVKNMLAVLDPGGVLYLHSHGPAFPYHPYPVDCYRFFKDAVTGMAQLSGAEVVDMLWTPRNWFVAMRKVVD